MQPREIETELGIGVVGEPETWTGMTGPETQDTRN